MRWQLVLFVLGLLTTGAHAFAPIEWMKAPAGGLIVMPKGFRGSVQGLVPPQELIVGQPGTNSLAYFTAMVDNTITWDDMGWCVEAGGRTNGDAVRVNQCNGGAAQKWNWIPDGHGRSMIQLKDSNQCLEVKEGGLRGNPIELQDCATRIAHVWKIEEPVSFATQASAQSLGSIMLHAIVALFALLGIGLLSVGALLWRPQNNTRMLRAGLGDVPMAMRECNDIWGGDVRPWAKAKRTGNISMLADMQGVPPELADIDAVDVGTASAETSEALMSMVLEWLPGMLQKLDIKIAPSDDSDDVTASAIAGTVSAQMISRTPDSAGHDVVVDEFVKVGRPWLHTAAFNLATGSNLPALGAEVWRHAVGSSFLIPGGDGGGLVVLVPQLAKNLQLFEKLGAAVEAAALREINSEMQVQKCHPEAKVPAQQSPVPLLQLFVDSPDLDAGGSMGDAAM